MRSFRLQSIRVLLTFSQTGNVGELELIQGYHLALLPPLSYYLLSREHHADGGIHHHLVVVFKEKLRTSDVRFFDWMFDGIHPNIQSIKHSNADIKRAIGYVKKDDDFVEDGISPLAPPREATMARISKLVLEGKSVAEIDILEHIAMIMHDQKIARSVARFESRTIESLLPWVPPLVQAVPAADLDPWHIQRVIHLEEMNKIAGWLRDNIRQDDRDARSPHLWLWSKASLIGKTRFISQLKTMLRVFDAPTEGHDWMTGFSDDYDLVVFEDYHGSMTLGFLKKFLQKYPMKVAQKHLGLVQKTRNVPTIFTANNPPEGIYHNVFAERPQELVPLNARLLVVNLEVVFNFYPQ